MSGDFLIRHLLPSDISQAANLAAANGWNQTEQDWLRQIELEPDGCFCVECDGVVAATTTSICYGRELAWIGMVLTAPEYRGRGFAQLLMNRTLDFLDSRAVAQIKLDATEMGARVYRKVGFVEECRIERWSRPAGLVAPLELFGPGFDPALDREAFAADRGLLLHQLAASGSSALSQAGFAMERPGRTAAYFGPCIATSTAGARQLVEWFLARHGGQPAYWDLLPDNSDAVQLARESGFSSVRQLTRMTLQNRARGAASDLSKIFAIAGFEYG